MAHMLQVARVQASSLAAAWRALHADVHAFGTANNHAHPLLALAPATGRLRAYPQREGDGEAPPDPQAWRTSAAWARRAWELVFASLPFTQTDSSPVSTWVERRRRFHDQVKATPTAGLRAHFFSLAAAQPPLADAVAWVREASVGAAPFLRGRAPDEWPARDVGGVGRRLFLLFDMHVSGV